MTTVVASYLPALEVQFCQNATSMGITPTSKRAINLQAVQAAVCYTFLDKLGIVRTLGYLPSSRNQLVHPTFERSFQNKLMRSNNFDLKVIAS